MQIKKKKKGSTIMKHFKTLILVLACLLIFITFSFHLVLFSKITFLKNNLTTDYLVSDVNIITDTRSYKSPNKSVTTLHVMFKDKLSKNRSVMEDKQKQTIWNREKDWTLFKGQLIFSDFRKFYNVSSKYLRDPFIHRHEFKLVMDNNNICDQKRLFVIYVIHSAIFQLEERQLIRSTWASVSQFQNKQIEHVFVVGQTTNNTLNTHLQNEIEKYKDIIQGNFIDAYRNLTYTHVLSLYWINRYCNHTKFVVKLDDDVMVNIPLLIGFLQNKTISKKTTNMLDCKFYLSDGPERSRKNKWYTTVNEYPFTKFPPYWEGLAYILTLDDVSKFIEATKLVPFLWIDDVYAAGFLPWVTGVVMNRPDMFSSSVVRNTTSMFYLYGKRWVHQTLWRDHWNTIIRHGNGSMVSKVIVI